MLKVQTVKVMNELMFTTIQLVFRGDTLPQEEVYCPINIACSKADYDFFSNEGPLSSFSCYVTQNFGDSI